jgi:hypothetical protein
MTESSNSYDDAERAQRVMALRADIASRLRAEGINLAEPTNTKMLDALSVSLHVEWTCSSLLSMADQFLSAAQLAAADVPPDTYHLEQYYQAGSAFLDAYTGQCSTPSPIV